MAGKAEIRRLWSIIGGELWPISYQSRSKRSGEVGNPSGRTFAEGETSVTEPTLSRNHTELMLKGFGADVRSERTTATVVGRPQLNAQSVQVPGDISSAAYWMVAGLIIPNSELTITNVGINPTRTGIIDALRAMGANLVLENIRKKQESLRLTLL